MNEQIEKQEKGFRKLKAGFPGGIYLLPSALTLMNILLGFLAIITIINHHHDPNAPHYYTRAALLILLAGFFDAIDGRVARMTNSTSPFGMELDSIADVISFGISPGILVYCWALEGFQRLGWVAAFLFLGCGAIRLARFNTQDDAAEKIMKRFFIGLPIPAAAGCLAILVMFKPEIQKPGFAAFLILLLVYILSFLMISKLYYRSFKDVDWARRRPVGVLFFFIVVLTVILYEPVTILFCMILLYVASGILGYFFPNAFHAFFRKLDKVFWNIKILDDDDLEKNDEMDALQPEPPCGAAQ